VDNAYDARGNVLTRKITDNATGESRRSAYTYNPFGRMTSSDGPRQDVNDVTTYTYYECTTGAQCGQLRTITNPLGHITTFLEYNAHGQPTKINDANNVQTTVQYDRRLMPISINTAGQTTTLTYDERNNMIRQTLSDETFISYEWDVANRLVAVNDSQGNRIEWTLDTEGNRVSEITKDPTGTAVKNLSRAFDSLSRLVRLTPAHNGPTTYEYDANSNSSKTTDADSRTTTQAYDALDRLVNLTDAIETYRILRVYQQPIPLMALTKC